MGESLNDTSGRMGLGLKAVALAALALWLWATIPLALGQRTLYFRDVFTTHLPVKAFGAAELRAGRIPAFNPAWGLGQPFRGNPNALPFYPGNVLYLILPFWSAFNLHYALHWLLAALTMAALARALGQGPAAALTAGVTYAGSGWILTTLSFYNLLAVSAWWPLVLLGAARGGRRGIALGGIACGMALLAGEPVTAALGIVPLLLVACQRHGFRRGALAVLGIGVTGVSIALPQLVATTRILGFTSRSALGAAGLDVFHFHLGLARLLELILPFPFGHPWDLGKGGYWSWDEQPGLPYILTLHFGIVALWLAVLGVRRARGWGLLAAAGIVLAWAGAFGGDALVMLTHGLVRYPEKLLFWLALAVSLLAGWGLERVLASPRAWRGAAIGAGAALALAVIVFLAGSRLADWLAAGRVSPEFVSQAPAARVGVWIVALVLAAALLGLAAMAARRGSAAGLAASQLVALLPLAGLVMTARVADFPPSPWLRMLRPGAEVVPGGPTSPPVPPTYLTLVQTAAFDLGPAPGALYTLRYPFGKDLDGLYSPLSASVLLHLPRLDADARANWMRTFGAGAAVLPETPATSRLQLLAVGDRFGGTSRLFAVRDPAPSAWWPRSVTAARSAGQAFQYVSRAADTMMDDIAARPVVHHPGAWVSIREETPDRIAIDVWGDGGLLVLRRAFQPLYKATAGGRPLPTLPVNLSLLGIEVPPGGHRVWVEVSTEPEVAAGVAAWLAFLIAAVLAWRRDRFW
ncbi:MAG: hypothetical protein DMF53_03045 [Acidobacteria bacterium]|nr:MAG: hypothetical protein DMF53_03045 [Acidobacteriota bacterium]